MNHAQPENQSVAASSPILLGAYLAHLVVPLVFVAASLQAVHVDAGGVWEKVIIVGGTLWILVVLGALAFSRNRRDFLDRVAGPLTAVYAIYFSLGLVELGTEIWFRRINAAPLNYPPGMKRVVDRSRLGLRGVPPIMTYSVNELGLRGPSPPREGRVHKIIMVGGSTTECAALDDSQEWPHLVMQIMNDQQKQRFVWVGNAGVSAATTVDHFFWLKRLPVLSQADLLVFLIGINDLQATLDFGGAPTQKVLEYRAERQAEHAAYESNPQETFFRRARLFALVKESLHNLPAILRRLRGNSTREPKLQFAMLKARRASLVPVPDLRVGLQEYAQRIRSLEYECRARGVRCAFLTQPVMWRADLPPDEQNLLWMGWVGWKAHRRGYASLADLALAMDAYNQALLSVCREDHLECYDLASSVPRDTSAFYDDCHFNTGGARLVAQFLGTRLLATPPFWEAGSQGR